MLAGQPLFSSPVTFTVTPLLLYFFSKSQPNKLNMLRTIKNQFIPTKESSVKQNLLTQTIPAQTFQIFLISSGTNFSHVWLSDHRSYEMLHVLIWGDKVFKNGPVDHSLGPFLNTLSHIFLLLISQSIQ